mgnify:CR=1 FL=1
MTFCVQTVFRKTFFSIGGPHFKYSLRVNEEQASQAYGFGRVRLPTSLRRHCRHVLERKEGVHEAPGQLLEEVFSQEEDGLDPLVVKVGSREPQTSACQEL